MIGKQDIRHSHANRFPLLLACLRFQHRKKSIGCRLGSPNLISGSVFGSMCPPILPSPSLKKMRSTLHNETLFQKTRHVPELNQTSSLGCPCKMMCHLLVQRMVSILDSNPDMGLHRQLVAFQRSTGTCSASPESARICRNTLCPWSSACIQFLKSVVSNSTAQLRLCRMCRETGSGLPARMPLSEIHTLFRAQIQSHRHFHTQACTILNLQIMLM
mmetsp:Transcript_86884/g.158708  ORF Transcript_86884/g.158708 Transcript_86884/m.158708 type:complete len:216 (-) Transcript_86884:1031-1678(-)